MSDLATRFHRLLSSRLENAVAAEAGNLARGLAKDHSDYRHRCGQIRGLEAARSIADEVLKALFADDDQEN